MENPKLREPVVFACGDTLIFERYLPDYLPDDGWELRYEIRGGASGTEDAVAFASSLSSTNGARHRVEVAAATTANWLPGQYVLVGTAVNGEEQHKIYEGALTLSADMTGTPDAAVKTTHAQRMITLIEAQLERLAQHELDESNVQQAQFIRAKRLDLERQLAINKEIRMAEVAQENARNGLPSGNKITPVFNITQPGLLASRGWPYRNS